MKQIIISYKEFIEKPSIIFNYDHSKIKIGDVVKQSNNYIQLGYFKNNKLYDKFIIEVSNNDIEYFYTKIYQYWGEVEPYINLKKYNLILNRIINEIIKQKITEINNKYKYYKNINYYIQDIDNDKLIDDKIPKDIQIIYYNSNKEKINLKNIYSDLLNDLIKKNKVNIQLELKINMITPWDSITDNLIELYMNVLNIKIYKKINYIETFLKENIINNTIDFNNSIYNFDIIYNKLIDGTYNFQQNIINILNYFNLNYNLNENKNYNISNRYYIKGENIYFTNMTIIFDDKFLNYNITEKIKQEFYKVYIEDEYYMNDIFFVEKEKNKEYVIIYSNNYRYGYDGNEIIDIFKLYSNVLKMLVNICDINKYTKKINKKSISNHNKYNIINRTFDNYINKDYSKYNNKLLYKVLCNILENKYEDFDYNIVNAYIIKFKNGIVCFQNKTLKNEFDKELKKLIKEKKEKDKKENKS